ncbi:MAG: hypothetical protein JWO05_3505 [Gemmatimonadetes bacterium]|nr:hypothetical protein [Gemmatimonadota bacterium]
MAEFVPQSTDMTRRKLTAIPGGADKRSPDANDRRRDSWSEFRHAYPGVIVTFAIAIAALLATDGYLLYQRQRYASEVARLRDGMTKVERERADAAMANDEDRLKVTVELMRRQAHVAQALHLSVAVDSTIMYLEQEGAILRAMPLQVGAEKRVGAGADTVHLASPRGARTVERLMGADDAWEVPVWVYQDRGLPVPAERALKGALGPDAIVLAGGTVIYSMPSVGPLNDSSYVLPGSIRARSEDIRAVRAAIKSGTTVYFY